MITLRLRKSIGRSPLRLGFFLIPLALACFTLSPATWAQLSPPPDGGYWDISGSFNNTAEGTDALFKLCLIDCQYFGGFPQANTAIGFHALYNTISGHDNTGIGSSVLYFNNGNYNTASGSAALFWNTTGSNNTASGVAALSSNQTGNNNTATGYQALWSNVSSDNTATGFQALLRNTSGGANTAIGGGALHENTTGSHNTASGHDALYWNNGDSNTAIGSATLFHNGLGSENAAAGGGALYQNMSGNNNTALGINALFNNRTGGNNIGLGHAAGSNITGSNNIDIGHAGVAGESGKMRIGTTGTHTATFIAGIYNVSEGGTIKPVYINSNGRLGTQPPASARRFKTNIKPMDKSSEAVLALKPVTFHYKNDEQSTAQFGLIAEEVAKVSPELVVRDDNGEIYTVRYDAVNAMLLNEFLKEHRKVEEQGAIIAQLKSVVEKQETASAQQQKQIEALTVGLQKVSAQIEVSKAAPATVLNNH